MEFIIVIIVVNNYFNYSLEKVVIIFSNDIYILWVSGKNQLLEKMILVLYHLRVLKTANANIIRKKRGQITTATTEIQRIVRNYYEEIYAKKFENLCEMDKFLEKCNLPKLNEEEAESLNRPRIPDEIEAVVKKLLTHKSPGPDGFTVEFYRAFRGKLTPILHRLFQKIQEDGRLPKLFL